MKFTTILLMASLAGAALGAAGQTRAPAPPPQDQSIVTAEASPRAPTETTSARSTEFLMDALRASLANARMGELAMEQSGDQRVRDYGTRLKSDFASHAADIQQLLMPLDVSIPTQLSAEAISRLATLARLSGKEFDMAFVQQMIWTHTDAIERYGAQTHANPDRSVHEFAAASLPMLREQLAKAEALR
jgi:putative membrane protein